jgi:DDE superfamily endonuclease
MFGKTCQVGSLKRGWLNNFMEWHPRLSLQTAQIVKRVRAEASEEGLNTFCLELYKHGMERKFTSNIIFNMDKTGFCQNCMSKKVVAVHGSNNVWSKWADSLFHLTVVACVGANGFAVPPTLVVPGQCLSWDLMDGCDIPGGSVTVAPKGFMNAHLFEKWLSHFCSAVLETTKRPLILVYDVYSSPFNEDIVTKAISLNIILVLLPSKATSLVQPLHIALFKPCKTIMNRMLYQRMIENAIVSISKKMQCSRGSITNDVNHNLPFYVTVLACCYKGDKY